jgi:hypothetical protein
VSSLASNENNMLVPIDVGFAIEIVGELDLFAASPA